MGRVVIPILRQKHDRAFHEEAFLDHLEATGSLTETMSFFGEENTRALLQESQEFAQKCEEAMRRFADNEAGLLRSISNRA